MRFSVSETPYDSQVIDGARKHAYGHIQHISEAWLKPLSTNQDIKYFQINVPKNTYTASLNLNFRKLQSCGDLGIEV